MINKHDFQQAAKSFRAGRLSLPQFTQVVFAQPRGATETFSEPRAENPSPPTTSTSPTAWPTIPTRATDAHKGNFGRVLLIGGSAGMAGAISLASLAALRCGSGLVKAAVPREIQATVASFSPCYMTIGCLSENGEFHGASLDSLETAAEWADVVALGPGMERGAAQKWIVPKLYASLRQSMIVDADGLNTLADVQANLADHAGPRILTPHAGEFQRLIGVSITDRQELERRAIGLAQTAKVVIVLKGHHTLVTDGQQTYHNSTGNPGMATAGSGDILTGMIASLVGQGLAPLEAAKLGVYLHGLAGDLAANGVGESSLIATDLLDYLSVAIKKQATELKSHIGF